MKSAVPRVALALSLVLAACGSKDLLLTMSVASGDRILDPGGHATITLKGAFVDASGNQTPATGTVALTVDKGTLSAASVALDATGAGTVDFTMCDAAEGCTPGTKVIVKGTLTNGSQTAPGSALFTVRTSGASCGGGTADCKDAACENQVCTPSGGGTGKCSSGSCKADPASNANFEVTLATTDSHGLPVDTLRLPAGGKDFIKFVATVTKKADNKPAAGEPVHFSTDAGGLATTGDGAGAATLDVVTDDKGRAAAFFVPGTKPATATVDVKVQDLTIQRIVDIVVPGTFNFAPSQSDRYHRVMGVRGSGYQESSVLRFALLDTEGKPYTGGGSVKFEVKAPGGVTIAPASASLDANGEVVTTLYSGTMATTLAVKATVDVGTPNLTAVTDTIVIVGAKPSGRNFSVSCADKAIPALVGNDCAYMRADLSTTCTAVLGDRYNNALGRRTQLTWSTEAALFGPPSSTPEASPDADPVGQTGLGRSSNSLRTLNSPMPADVDPTPGEPTRTSDATDPCVAGGSRNYNPRDGLNTFIVSTQGEEGFQDANGNGVWDQGEKFDDLAEPFVDANDNNQADPGESFLDVNGNGKWDAANGTWDADTTIWAVGHVMFTGTPGASVSVDPSTPIQFGGSAFITATWVDENLNISAPKYTTFDAPTVTPVGSVSLLTPATLPDSYGAIDIVQTRTCATAACTLAQFVKPRSVPTTQARFDAPGAVIDPVTNAPADAFKVSVVLGTTVGTGLTVKRSVIIDGGAGACDDSAGAADCRKASCTGKRCVSGTLHGICRQGVCDTSSAGDGAITLVGTLKRQDGAEPPVRVPALSEPLVYTVHATTSAGTAADGKTVTFVADASIGGLVPAGNASATPAATLTATTDASGVASVWIKPGSQAARGQVVATVDAVSVAVGIETVVAANLQFAPLPSDPYYRVMGVRTSGWREQNVLRFRILDSDGLPYLGKATINFTVPPSGGVTMIPSTVNVDPGQDAITTIYSGTGAGTVAVTATTTVGGVTLRTTSETIAVVGAKASSRNFAVSCDRLAIPALLRNDCSFSTIDITATCTAVLGDRFNNTLGRNVKVFWSTEAALFGPPSSTILADPDTEPADQPDLGRSINTLRTLNAPLPKDVPPITGEPQVAIANDPCKGGARTANPRDGLVTLIAHTQGEEGFIDDNGNGTYDAGEKFFDQGEPFVDANDNDVRDPDEEFIDVNNNKSYDPPNGKWDGDTTVWATTRIAFTGSPSAVWSPTQAGTLPTITGSAHLNFAVSWLDQNLNESAPTFTTYTLTTVDPSQLTVKQLNPPPPSGIPTDLAGSMGLRRITKCDTTTKVCALSTLVDFYSRPQLGVAYIGDGSRRISYDNYIDATVAIGDGPLLTLVSEQIVPAAPPPAITSMTPNPVVRGSEVHIVGTALGGSDLVNTKVYVGSVAYSPAPYGSETDLYFTPDATTPVGTYTVRVVTSTGATVAVQPLSVQ